MYRMDKLTTGIAYGTSAGNAGFLDVAIARQSIPIPVGRYWCSGKSGIWLADIPDESVFQN